MNTGIKFYSTVKSRLSQLPISNGQFIFVRDEQVIYFDSEGERTKYAGFTTLLSESQRVELKTPLSTFYFILETKKIWFYDVDSGWSVLNDNSTENFYSKQEIDEMLKKMKMVAISQIEIDVLF